VTELREQIVDLLGGRPGWKLEPSSTPGAPPAWCYVDAGVVEFSVTGEAGHIRLYVMATDEELTFDDGLALSAWLGAHRADALRPPVVRERGPGRWRKMLRWE
jgi:hypothetical protein